MKPRVYLETSVVSYLTAWRSRDLLVAAHQQITRAWWQKHRTEYDVFVSQIVVGEASEGDPIAAQERLEILKDVPLLAVRPEAVEFAGVLVQGLPLPANADTDALHIALATIERVNYLLTWNCRHIANATLRKRLESLCRAQGFEAPVICTPEELLGD